MDKIFFVLLACLIHFSSQNEGKNYTGVVVEYHPEPDTDSNIEMYGFLTASAVKAYKADIVVFPETTLTRSLQLASLVPEPAQKVIPYKNESYANFKVIRLMSQLAAKYEAYLVVNLFERENCTKGKDDCPEKGYFLYNTNVAFDRKGTVVARYRKINVYDENGISRPKGNELSTFTTDFGVTFGIFTSFDILFKTPGLDLVKKKNVRQFIFPNNWYGELPFLTAVQIQGGWSYATGATLLSAGSNDPEIGSTGTGVYEGRKSWINMMLEATGTGFIYWGIPRNPAPRQILSLGDRDLNVWEDPSIPSAKKVQLSFKSKEFKDEVCHNGLCCKFNVTYKTSSGNNPDDYTYSAVAFQGQRRFGKDFRLEVAYCALVLCTKGNCAKKPTNNNYPLIFDQIQIEAEFKTENTFQIPNTLIWDYNQDAQVLNIMKCNSYDFQSKEIKGSDKSRVSIELKSKNVNNLITFGIFGRKFS